MQLKKSGANNPLFLTYRLRSYAEEWRLWTYAPQSRCLMTFDAFMPPISNVALLRAAVHTFIHIT